MTLTMYNINCFGFIYSEVFPFFLLLSVVTAALASDALSIIEEKKDELNLVLVEARLPDMEIHELTEKIKESSDLPSFSKF